MPLPSIVIAKRWRWVKLVDADRANLENALDVQESRASLAKALAESKDRVGALEVCAAAIHYAGIAAAAQPRNLQVLGMLPRALGTRAGVLAGLGEWSEARDAYQRALAAWEPLKTQKGFDATHAAAIEATSAGLARCDAELAKRSGHGRR